MKIFQKIYADPERVAEQFARHLAEWMAESEQEHFHIALSGGSTPRLLFDLLARDYANKFPWDIMHFWWGDERCVPPDDADSNFGMTRKHLLDHIDIPEGNIHRVRGENDPATEAIRYGKTIQEFLPIRNGWPVFDLIMLGLGTDGHTASIFPHQMELLEDPNVCVVATHPDSGQKRISLSGGVINEGERIAFLATGVSKAEKYSEIVEQKGSFESYPASYIHPEKGELYWFIDQAAAGQ
ncbi:MAG: 6-phosphogluconolactonase [Bacteroidia bacterium]|nr:6-phosphogluconolactonase [Bacteroidia bacterium]